MVDRKGVLGLVALDGLGLSPNQQPPAQTLWSVSQSLYTGRPHTSAATRPLAPPRHLSRPLGTTSVPLDRTVGSNQTAVPDERRWSQVCAAVPAGDREERGFRAEHGDRPVEPRLSVKSTSDIDDSGGGALEIAHREEVAGSSLSGRHGGARSRPGLTGRTARGRGGTSSRDVLRLANLCGREAGGTSSRGVVRLVCPVCAQCASTGPRRSSHPCGLRRLQLHRSQQALWPVRPVALQLRCLRQAPWLVQLVVAIATAPGGKGS